MKYLAIGCNAEDQIFLASREVTNDNPQTVADYLKSEFGCDFDQILLVQNDEVVHHWNIGEDYVGTQTNIV